jgi:hypothetical protein
MQDHCRFIPNRRFCLASCGLETPGHSHSTRDGNRRARLSVPVIERFCAPLLSGSRHRVHHFREHVSDEPEAAQPDFRVLQVS